jgi:c-di-GMP-binding flagellar brake protein YcgR
MNEMKFSGAERRKAKRLRVNLSILFRLDQSSKVRMFVEEQEIRATMVDLSETGLALLTNVDLPDRALLAMKFTLFRVEPDDVSFYGPIEIVGEVRYRQQLTPQEFRVGIVFSRIEDADKQEIGQFVKVTG